MWTKRLNSSYATRFLLLKLYQCLWLRLCIFSVRRWTMNLLCWHFWVYVLIVTLCTNITLSATKKNQHFIFTMTFLRQTNEKDVIHSLKYVPIFPYKCKKKYVAFQAIVLQWKCSNKKNDTELLIILSISLSLIHRSKKKHEKNAINC